MRYVSTPGFAASCAIMALLVGSYAAMLGSFPMALVQRGTLPSAIGGIIAGYSFGAVACRLVFSAWIDRLAWRIPIMLGAVLMAVSCVLLDPRLDPVWLFVLRLTYGVGFGAASAATYASMAAKAPRAQRGLAIGMFSAVAGLAIVTMPPLGVITFSRSGFPAVAWLSTAMALVAAGIGLAVRGSALEFVSKGVFRPGWTTGLLIASVGFCAIPMGAIEVTIPYIAKAERFSGLALIYAVFGVSLVIGRAAGGALGDRMSRGRLVAYGLLAAGASQTLAVFFLNEYSLILIALLGGGGMGAAATNLNALLSLHVLEDAQGRALSWSGVFYDSMFAAGAALGGASVQIASTAPFVIATLAVVVAGMIASLSVSRLRAADAHVDGVNA